MMMNQIATYQGGQGLTRQLSPATADFLKAVFEAGTAPNTRRAYQKDMLYFEAWANLARPEGACFPVPVAAVLQFISDHLGGMAAEVEAALVGESKVKAMPGPHSLATIRRRLASLSVAHETARVANPVKDSAVKETLKKAGKALASQGVKPRKKRAAIKGILDAMLSTCGDSLLDTRDRALLLFAAASGGRRRSEVVGAMVEDLTPVEGGYIFHLQRSKTDQAGQGEDKPVLGRAARALETWLSVSGIKEGPLFRGVNRHGQLMPVLGNGQGLTGETVARIVKQRAYLAARAEGMGEGQAREYAAHFGAHSLRSGFVTEWGLRGGSRGEGMALTGHRSSVVFDSYYQAGAVLNNPAARIFD